MNDAAKALGKTEYAALDLLRSMPDETAKVASRANANRGIISRVVADRLVKAEQAQYLQDDPHRITTWGVQEDDTPARPEPVPDPEETEDEPTAPTKPNGRRAKADASPYSTAPVAGYVKRECKKSRRTGAHTRVVDLLHPKREHDLEGSGRYEVQCLTHQAAKAVPDMTEAKPLQARTDQFCDGCAQAVQSIDAQAS